MTAAQDLELAEGGSKAQKESGKVGQATLRKASSFM